MAKNTVPVNFKDDIMNSSMGGKRRYKMINNSDGTISLEDATTYDQVGSNFGAAQLNATNKAVNAAADAGKIIDDLDAINNVTKEGYMAGALALKQVNSNLGGLRFGVDGDGNYGYYGADDSLIPFSNISSLNDLDLLIEFTNRFPDFACGHNSNSGIVIRSNIFKQLKSFTIAFQTNNGHPAYYLRYTDSSGKITNLDGWNNTATSAEFTKTVNCSGASAIEYDVFFIFTSSYATMKYFKILSYELL